MSDNTDDQDILAADKFLREFVEREPSWGNTNLRRLPFSLYPRIAQLMVDFRNAQHERRSET